MKAKKRRSAHKIAMQYADKAEKKAEAAGLDYLTVGFYVYAMVFNAIRSQRRGKRK